ncbi:xanthine dehydrogenase-like [Schistocerca gregaria]|uniref:xanthine dehydrogenase-like n=1 Tax=Schistocerca gregaria TaxID=7010 RepID=UPI00211E4F73|nr:xanthine dehydrogenase-like [Schistocerca gregaria]
MGATASTEFQQVAVFHINGKEYQVDNTVPVDTSLNTYIRNYANLKGTKAMCHEGGCGSCIVMVTRTHPVSKKVESFAVNSCLMPVFSCHNCKITTIEGIGNKKVGYNRVQRTLAAFNGTQCGYCSPGMVMNMYSLLQRGKDITMADVENSFGGNICRCTGYRPILDAFKSLSSDASPDLKGKYPDIEDITEKICAKSGKPCNENCANDSITCDQEKILPTLHLKAKCSEWFKVDQIDDIFNVLAAKTDKKYMLVAGNTAHGVYRRKPDIEIFIDISDVQELKKYTIDSEITVGGNMSLTEVMELFYDISKSNKKFSYTKMLADHIDLVANVPVRNAGTIAGNLSIKHMYQEFPSDIFLILEAADAKINIVDRNGAQFSVSPAQYLKINMNHKIIKNITLPPYDDEYYFKTYKIMPRAQNAHAYVNAGFLFKLDINNVGKVISKPRIVFGGINQELVHAKELEQYLEDENLYELNTLEQALRILDSEIQPVKQPPEASPEYRKGLAVALFYKFVLSISPENVKPNLRSGGEILKRPLSSGKHEYDTKEELWPLGEPVSKLEALFQCSGEAKYVNDVLTIPGELYCAFVVTSIANGHIRHTDPSDALAVPGVVAYYDAKDIPGKNNFYPKHFFSFTDEEIFCSGNVKYNGQPIGMIVAVSHNIAVEAAKLVKIDYDVVNKPIIHLRDALTSGEKSRIMVIGEIKPTDPEKRKKMKHVIKGNFDIGTQYHYTMETQCAVCIPMEDSIDVYPATQWMDETQIAISEVLKVPENRINIQVRRLGGGYGAKVSRNMLVSTACALAAHLQNRPVRFILPLETSMESIGKRHDCAIDYEVGVEDDGTITYLEGNTYHNCGDSLNDHPVIFMLANLPNCYDISTWKVTASVVFTDLPSNTWCRSPGTTEGIAFIENIMEHIAKELGKDAVEVKLKNLAKNEERIADMISYWKTKSDYSNRVVAVQDFNKNNRWRKRGISVVPMRYRFDYFSNFYAIVSVYAHDGTISVAHGGIECGQGINTKVAQVCAYALGVPLELVSIKPSNVLTSPNNMVTGGSIASESCAYATLRACEELLKRLAPIKEKLKDPSWQELIAAAYAANVDLCSTFMMYAGITDALKNYYIYGVTVAEVEVDALTGEHQILRVDILEDAGESLSPEIDIGQVEGAFVMGLGYWLKEFMVYDNDTGKALTNRTWNYKPPGAKDIPIDLRIQLRKNAPNPVGVLRSKATGEPPLCMSICALFAIREAVLASRQASAHSEKWFEMNPPATPEKVFLASLINYKQFEL